ncbi:hypothetical protein ACTMTJ_39610 [Phytohabitans sp. LJ34]|uniref:hypothetical protein n=1 Tax=Phytohabitans sp. LJ34 TaxID=3452217 RepID=UPI003F8CB3E1
MSYVRTSLAFSLALAAGAALLVATALQVLMLQAVAIDPMLLAHPVIVLDTYAFRSFDPMLLANPVIVLDTY